MTKISQTGRVAELRTPLGKDVLVLGNFSGTEGLGELFEFQIEALSEIQSIDFDKVLGQSCTVELKVYEGQERMFNGILTQAQCVGSAFELGRYRLTLRPWFWLLGHKADCRIFLNKKVTEILREVFTRAGFNDFEFRTTEAYDEIPYCVQYRETDLAFCSRLMEQYGIYYFFEHSDGKHDMILADARSSHRANPHLPTLPFIPRGNSERYFGQHVCDWISDRRVRAGKVEFNDYDYLKPPKRLRAPSEANEQYAHSKLEIYDYPGKYDKQDEGRKLSKIRLEAEQSLDHRRFADGDAGSVFPGSLVTLQQHPVASENREYLAVRAGHRLSSGDFRSNVGGGAGQLYFGFFELQPSDRPFRSLPLTPKPRIYGIQTAKVVGRKGQEGEEISTDENGHVWVQFHWDREPQKSCPVRVAQPWAGRRWGHQFLPRIGMEVVVEFLEGDPDRPLVTGSVYNGDNKVPYELPANKTQSGVKSDSSKGHDGYNEFMFEDKKGDELVRLHAQKNHQVIVLADQDGSVGGDQTWTVGNDRSWTIEKGDDTIVVDAGSQRISIAQEQHVTAGSLIVLKVGTSIVRVSPGSITMHAPTINLMADNSINLISGTGVNITPVLNAVAANLGAATVDGGSL